MLNTYILFTLLEFPASKTSENHLQYNEIKHYNSYYNLKLEHNINCASGNHIIENSTKL